LLFIEGNSNQRIPIMRMITVTKKHKPHPIAAILKRHLSMATLAEYPGDAYNNSEVIRSIIAVTASHKAKSKQAKEFLRLKTPCNP
jgi:hypothetical protein